MWKPSAREYYNCKYHNKNCDYGICSECELGTGERSFEQCEEEEELTETEDAE